MTDEELMQQYQQGHESGFVSLFKKYKTKIFNFCMRLLFNRADAEEATSDVFVTVCVKKHAWRPVSTFRAWLYTVAHNTCMSILRKRKNMIGWFFSNDEDEEYEIQIPDSGDTPDVAMRKKEAGSLIKKAVHDLPMQQKEALVLRAYQDLSYQEIAEVLDCTIENVKILIYRARKQLSKELPSFVKEGML